ncbi:MAG: hypothetical protein RJA70_3631 [Pseudomonadota bacterium]
MSTQGLRLVIADLLDETALAQRSWEPFREGLDVCWLYRVDGGPSAALLRYAPGAHVPEHAHEGFEHIVVLHGEQADDTGPVPAGSCLIHGPGTHHSVTSVRGCIVLAIWEKPVRFL